MYTSFIVVVVFVLIGVVSGTGSAYLQRLPSTADQTKVNLDLCPTCINEAVELINVVLNVILDEGIETTCAKLGEAVANKTGKPIIGFLVELGCIAVGLDEFIKIIIKVDLDPIWYCELVDMCPINDNGDAKFTKFSVTPTSGHSGTEFVIDCSFTTKNGTGTGMLRLGITDPKNESTVNDFLLEGKKPGTYPERIGFKTLYRNCDLSTGLCDAWPTGQYNVTAELCYGECESHHPHSSVYDMGKSSFVITPKK